MPAPGLGPVGGEFQPQLESGYPGGGAYLIKLCRLSRLCPFGRLKDVVDFIPSPEPSPQGEGILVTLWRLIANWHQSSLLQRSAASMTSNICSCRKSSRTEALFGHAVAQLPQP